MERVAVALIGGLFICAGLSMAEAKDPSRIVGEYEVNGWCTFTAEQQRCTPYVEPDAVYPKPMTGAKGAIEDADCLVPRFGYSQALAQNGDKEVAAYDSADTFLWLRVFNKGSRSKVDWKADSITVFTVDFIANDIVRVVLWRAGCYVGDFTLSEDVFERIDDAYQHEKIEL